MCEAKWVQESFGKLKFNFVPNKHCHLGVWPRIVYSSVEVFRNDGDNSVSMFNVLISFDDYKFSISIRRAGYPIRHNFEHFVERYRMLWSKMTPEMVKGADAKTNSIKLAKEILGEPGGERDWQVGVTKVFIKVLRLTYTCCICHTRMICLYRMRMINI